MDMFADRGSAVDFMRYARGLVRGVPIRGMPVRIGGWKGMDISRLDDNVIEAVPIDEWADDSMSHATAAAAAAGAMAGDAGGGDSLPTSLPAGNIG